MKIECILKTGECVTKLISVISDVGCPGSTNPNHPGICDSSASANEIGHSVTCLTPSSAIPVTFILTIFETTVHSDETFVTATSRLTLIDSGNGAVSA